MKYVPVLLLFLVGCSTGNFIEINDNLINVEIVDTNEERARGLMFREELCENCGMLFIFEDSKPRNFWMKNTLIPLDIIFINENFEIVDIEFAVPCVEEACRTYDSDGNSKYVLEVNAGFTEENNIKIGDKLEL